MSAHHRYSRGGQLMQPYFPRYVRTELPLCPDCGASDVRRYSLRQRKYSAPAWEFRCANCQRIFVHDRARKGYPRSTDNPTCPRCSRRTRRNGQQAHCPSVVRFQCDACGITFNSRTRSKHLPQIVSEEKSLIGSSLGPAYCW
jgi:transposase-like protein